MNKIFDVIIIGGGVIGMSAAWKISQTGRKVLLLEQGSLGQEASQAAAGMLGAQLEVASDGDFFRLCVESRNLYPAFSQELFEETGIDIQLTHNGILHLAQTEDEVLALQSRAKWQGEAGLSTEWWSAQKVANHEPLVNVCQGALLLPNDSNISAPSLTKALGVAASKRATVMEGEQVYTIIAKPGHVDVVTNSGTFTSEHVLIAAGAWAQRLLGQIDFPFRVYPVKGQVCQIRPMKENHLHHTVFSDHAYLVPKRDGTIIVGATEDHHSGFDQRVTASATAMLLAALQRIAPDLANSQFERVWSGLRPGSPTSLPLLGPIPHANNVWVAAGHFRNGILLAPVTAQLALADLEGTKGPDHWYAFSPKER